MRLLAVVLGVAGAAAQLSGWEPDQVNTTMCYWEQLRATTIRDMLYMDGGSMYWKPQMADGSDVGLSKDENPQGVMFTLNFSLPFDTSQNTTALFVEFSKGATGSGTSNIAPDYYDGAILSNNDEMFLFGGLLSNTATYTQPDADEGLYYEAYLYGVNRTFTPRLGNYNLPSGMTRYVAYGGAANGSPENKAWYFSGMRSPVWGPIFDTTSDKSLTPSTVSNTLITLNMTTQTNETWHNRTLPDTVKGRANPELVWVPVGKQGILVAIGGVVYPDFINITRKSSNATASKEQSPVFMTTIDVYDISNDTWYKQTTTGGGPGQLTRACAVLGTAADESSFNIYSYGGYDGLDATNEYSDDVWVLSLPSFTWTQVFAGNTSHGRAGHRCVLPYPDQMFVVGGYASMANTEPCTEGGILQVFNLSSAEWLTSYSPDKWANYSVPDAVVKVIGGDGKGSATVTQPAATGGWDTVALGAVFSTAYKTAIPTYYPYPLADTTTKNGSSTTTGVPTLTPSTSHGSKVPSFLPPLLGVICGLMAVSLCVLAFVMYRKRALLRRGSQSGGRRNSRGTNGDGGPGSDASTYDTRANAIRTWMRGITYIKRTPTTTGASSYDGGTTGSPISPDMEQVQGGSPHMHYAPLGGRNTASGGSRHSPAVEVADTSIAEMMADTHHPPAELSADPASSDVSSSRFSRGEKVVSFVSSAAELESITSKPRHARAAAAAAVPTATTARPDSPPLGTIGLAGVFLPPSASVSETSAPALTPSAAGSSPGPDSGCRGLQRESGISELSDSDRKHLRQGSEGGESVTSGTSSLVSPSTPQLTAAIAMSSGPAAAGRPHPIPEAIAAEAAAEAETARSVRPHTHIQPASSSAQQAAPSPPSPGTGSLGTLRRSIFRESEEDMSG